MRRRNRRIAWTSLLLTIAMACAVVFAGRHWLLVRGAHWLDVGRPLEHADYVMPLPGDAERRPFVAASIVRLGMADGVLIPKTEMGPDVQDGIIPPTHEIATAVLRSRGIDSDRITVLDTKDATTFDDARALAGFLDSHPDASVLIVTNAYHTRRAQWVFLKVLENRAERVRFFSAPNPRFHTQSWWRTEHGFNAVCSEYLKLLFYWCRYGFGLVWVGVVVGVVAVLVFVVVRRRRVVVREE